MFVVVVNDEDQYSIWRADEDLPPGWREAGMRGTREACLDYVETAWTDMTPRSVREAIARSAEGGSNARHD
jgi:MbtH protein